MFKTETDKSCRNIELFYATDNIKAMICKGPLIQNKSIQINAYNSQTSWGRFGYPLEIFVSSSDRIATHAFCNETTGLKPCHMGRFVSNILS